MYSIEKALGLTNPGIFLENLGGGGGGGGKSGFPKIEGGQRHIANGKVI